MRTLLVLFFVSQFLFANLSAPSDAAAGDCGCGAQSASTRQAVGKGNGLPLVADVASDCDAAAFDAGKQCADAAAAAAAATVGDGSDAAMVRIEGGVFWMGADDSEAWPRRVREHMRVDGETPARRVRVAPFLIDSTEVTNAQFAAFAEPPRGSDAAAAAPFVSDAERYGWSFVFHLFLSAKQLESISQAVAGATWW